MADTVFDLVTVDWSKPQTKLWLFHVHRTCPTANVVLIPDTKPVPWCWSSGKLNCFADLPELRHPGRFVYMDTDTIITRNVGEVFEMMGEDDQIAASCAIPGAVSMSAWAKDPRGRKSIDVAFGLPSDTAPVHYSTGFMALRDTDPAELGHKWLAAMEYPVLRARFGKHRCYEEIAFSYVVAADRIRVWDMPFEIHGNIMRRTYFGKTHEPMCIHYHQERRLRAQKLEKYLDTTAP